MGFDPNAAVPIDAVEGYVRIRVTLAIPAIQEKDASEIEAYLMDLAKQFPGSTVEFRRYPALASLVEALAR